MTAVEELTLSQPEDPHEFLSSYFASKGTASKSEGPVLAPEPKVGKCPFMNGETRLNSKQVVPNKLNMSVLNPAKHMAHINYAQEFKTLDLDEVSE